LDMRYL